MKVLSRIAFVAFYTFLYNPCFASENLSFKQSHIAAVVNGEAILASDVRHRVNWIIHISQIADTPVVRRQLTEQLLNAMINEALMRQTSEQYKIHLSEQELNESLDELAQQSNLSRQQLDTLLKTLHIPQHVLTNQMKAQLGWRKYMTGKYRGSIQISDEEIVAYKQAAQREKAESRYHLEEIVIPIEKDKSAAQRYAEDILDQLKHGSSFSSLAQQVSQAPSALNGGDLGLLRESQVPKDLLPHIKSLEEGQTSEPIKTAHAYHIVRLKRKHRAGAPREEVLISFMQAVLPLNPKGTQADLEKLMEEAAHIAKSVRSSAVFKKMMKGHATMKVRVAENVPMRGVHPDLMNILLSQPQGEVSRPVQTPEGIMFFSLEKRTVVKEPELDDEMIRTRLASERMNQIAAMNLKKLRQHAYIEQRV